MKVLGLLLCFLTLLLQAESQQPLYIQDRGTILGAFITANGIVFCSDSRSSMYDEQRQVAAYYEDVQKIFTFSDVIFGSAGLLTYEESNKTLFLLAKRFANNPRSQSPVESFYMRFLEFLRTELTSTEIKAIIKENRFLVAGYSNGQAKAYYYAAGRIQDSIQGATTYLTNLPKNEIPNNHPSTIALLKQKNMHEMFLFCEKWVTNYSNLANKNAPSIFGGPPSIAFISAATKKPEFYKKADKNSFNTQSELICAYLEGKLRISCRSESDKLRLAVGMQLGAEKRKLRCH